MPKIQLKETITKEIEIPLETIYSLVDALPIKDKKELLNRLLASIEEEALEFIPFRKDKIEEIISDFEAVNLYEEGFLRDLEEGLRKSSVYE